MEQTNQLISTAEAAKFLGIKPNGKLCFFDKTELEAWMKNIRVASQAELDREAQRYIVNRAKR